MIDAIKTFPVIKNNVNIVRNIIASLFIRSGLSKLCVLYRKYMFIRGKYDKKIFFLFVSVFMLIFSPILIFEKIQIIQNIIIANIMMINIFDIGFKIVSRI